MDARNYTCDYNFDWVEKMQKLTNKVYNDQTFSSINIFLFSK